MQNRKPLLQVVLQRLRERCKMMRAPDIPEQAAFFELCDLLTNSELDAPQQVADLLIPTQGEIPEGDIRKKVLGAVIEDLRQRASQRCEEQEKNRDKLGYGHRD